MKITFKNPHDKDFTASVAIPWAGVLLFPVRTFRLAWTLRQLSRMPPERAERVVHQVADEYEARGYNVTREDLKGEQSAE